MTDLHTSDELAEAVGCRSRTEALSWLISWLERRDDIFEKIKIDDISATLETIAAELRREAEQASPNSSGLVLAATVLTDTAEDVRAGDQRKDE